MKRTKIGRVAAVMALGGVVAIGAASNIEASGQGLYCGTTDLFMPHNGHYDYLDYGGQFNDARINHWHWYNNDTHGSTNYYHCGYWV